MRALHLVPSDARLFVLWVGRSVGCLAHRAPPEAAQAPSPACCVVLHHLLCVKIPLQGWAEAPGSSTAQHHGARGPSSAPLRDT